MVRKKQCAALVRLYDREIIRCLEPIYREPEKGTPFDELLSRGRIEELIGESDSEIEFAAKFFDEINDSQLSKADDERLYKCVMTYLQTNFSNSNIHRLLKCEDKSMRICHFSMILNHLDSFIRYLDPNAVLTYLECHPQYLEAVVALRQEIECSGGNNGEENAEFMKKMILRTIPLLGESAAYDIMYAVYNNSSNDRNEEAKTFIEQILRLQRGSFINFYKQVSSDRRQCIGRIYVCPINESATELLTRLPEINELRYRMINIQFENVQPEPSVPRLLIESVRNRSHLERQICLRGYQEELCRVALRGDNTIVCAPTGSGKTVIAAKIIKNHFETRNRNGLRFKALFMTPNSMILKQQSDSISSYLEHAYHAQIVQGADNVPVRSAIQSKDLVVATPQMIVNLCNEHREAPLTESEIGIEQFFLSTFTIIFFDECHNTLKNSPYANIMREYHTLKNMGNMPEGHHLPQIVGLTASLGTGDGKNELGVKEHIAKLCAMMNVKELSVVKENTEELQNYSPIVPDEVSYCERSTDGAIGEFTNWMCVMMKDVENLISAALNQEHILVQIEQPRAELFDDRPYRPTDTFQSPPKDKEHEGYLNWVCNQMNLVSTTKFNGIHTKIAINEALEVLKECYWTLSYNVNFNPEVALRYLKKELEARSGNFTPGMVRIWERYHNHLVSAGSAENPMIAKVEEFVVGQNQLRADSRAIIFVRTRYEATILKEILNNNETLLNLGIKSDWISGLNKASGSAEVNASKQKQTEKLKKFANGEIRLLVATSVAEEGLDVAECSLVIKYNYATNEIAHVQRRGRGRARNSKCVLVTNSIALRDQEGANRDKENMMNQALLKIQINPGAFQESVLTEIKCIWERIQREDTERAQKTVEQRNDNVLYNITCKKCGILLCTNRDIRSRQTQYFVCRPEFWSLVQKVIFEPGEAEMNRFNSIGKIKCLNGNCGALLGRLIDVSSTPLPCLAADAIVLMNGTEMFQVKKWKQILSKYFTPVELRQLDLQIMREANQRRAPLSFELHHNGVLETVIREG